MSVLTKSKVQEFISDLPFNSNVEIQKQAFNKLEGLEFPTSRDEYWKYTKVGKIANSKFQTSNECKVSHSDIEQYLVSDNFIVVENGIVRKELSSFDLAQVNVTTKLVGDVESDLKNIILNPSSGDSIFDELNTAFIEKVIIVSVPKNTNWEQSVQVLYVQTGENIISNTRLIIESEMSSSALITSTFVEVNAKNCFSNHITQIAVAENSNIKFDKIQLTSGLSVSTEYVTQQSNTTFKINTITLNGVLVRNNLNIEVEGQNCDTFLNGAVITKDKQVVDNHTFVNHVAPNCMSDETYKYVLDDKSIGTFNGRVVVKKDSQKINAYQDNGNILLSDYAKINSKPELEIYADDVKCSHGSTTGQLDEQALFYLQARGISKPKARHMLVQAFVGEVLSEIEGDRLNQLISKTLGERFGWEN
jgi:Fe-S cluster assembly protein SufD